MYVEFGVIIFVTTLDLLSEFNPVRKLPSEVEIMVVLVSPVTFSHFLTLPLT